MILEENRQLFIENANNIPDWKKKDLNQLCREYVQYKEENQQFLADACLSAIICKTWHIASRNYAAQKVKIASEEDCLNWNIDSILYILKMHAWDNENSAIYQDPKGPEKAIHVKIRSLKMNFYDACVRQKRKADCLAYSLDSLEENSSDGFYTKELEDITLENSDNPLYYYIRDLFLKKNYLTAFILDSISRYDLSKDKEFYKLALNKHLRGLTTVDCEDFADTYNISIDLVNKALPYIVNLSSGALNEKIDNIFLLLRCDDGFLNMLRCDYNANQ